VRSIRDSARRHGLVRPRRGRIIAGVCAGVGRWLDVSPWVVRLAALLSVLIPGPQFLLYVVLWIAIPAEERS